MSEEKTEKPTEKKLRDARKDGEVPVSPDVTA
ncbi:EscU/YscU/HrcU family type III secretion system export apparatus switch protein, partial [Xanthomonas perforans]|nr:EscU/YscU/HrcU family type III secretion system export apparatus switch protein [Xanthomonas perforans]